MNYLVQPKKYQSLMTDDGSRAIMDKTVAFFEKMGKERLLDDYNKKSGIGSLSILSGGSRFLPNCSHPASTAEAIRIAAGITPATENIANCWLSMAWATGIVFRSASWDSVPFG